MRSPELLRLKVNEFKRGERPDGSRIGYYVNPAYRSLKRSLNPLAGGSVDLILTGSFTRGLIVDNVGRGRYLFDSHDDKTGQLVEKYGSDIFLLNNDTWEQFQYDYVAPEINKYIIQKARGR